MTTTYTWDAQDYRDHSQNQQRWAQGLIARLNFKGHERVLDIGCGDGKVTFQIAQKVPQGSVVGVYASPAMVEFARQTFVGKVSNISFQEADAEALPFENEFDLVVSFACLHWVKDHASVLRGIHKSLKRGGQIFLQFGGKGTDKVIHDMADAVLSSPRWSSYFTGFEFPWNFFSADVYRNWVAQSGLSPRRVELVPYEGSFTREQLKGWLRSTWVPHLQRVPPGEQEEFLEAIVQNYATLCRPGDDGAMRPVFQRLEVEAEK